MSIKPVPGVFHLRHIASGQVYSGKTNNFQKQQDWHYALLCERLHKSRRCQELYNLTDDPKDFAFDIEVTQDLMQAQHVLLLRIRDARKQQLSLNEMHSSLIRNSGVFRIKFADGFVFLWRSQDIHKAITIAEWKLGLGRHPNVYLQQVWEHNHGEYTFRLLKGTYDEAYQRYCRYPKFLNVMWERHQTPDCQDALMGCQPMNPLARPVVIDGIVYGSIIVAGIITQIPFKVLYRRLRKDSKIGIHYL
jgi:hypothetical protein